MCFIAKQNHAHQGIELQARMVSWLCVCCCRLRVVLWKSLMTAQQALGWHCSLDSQKELESHPCSRPLLSSLDWLFLTVIPALMHPWSLWMFLGRVIKGRGVLEVDHLFYSILFRCGIYKGSKTGNERKAIILLNWRLPQNRQLQPSLSLFFLPVLSSMTWFGDHLQWDQKVIFPVLAPHATSLSHHLSAGWQARQEWILASLTWTMNSSRKDNDAVKVKLDLREPTKPWRCVLAVVSWGIQGNGYSKLSSAGDSLISPPWCIVCHPVKGSWEYKGTQLQRERGSFVPISAATEQ